MKLINKRFIFVLFILLISINSYASNSLYTPYEGLDFEYRWIDTNNYDTHNIEISGLYTNTPHQFGYNFKQVLGDDTLTQLGLTYAYKAGAHWTGFGISSNSDKPFTSLNLITFDMFYAFRIFQHVVEYETINGEAIPYYSRLYLGIDYSTDRILLDGYPLPIVRYEYARPGLNLIIGFPMTYIKAAINKNMSFELKYVPVIDILASYNVAFNKNHSLNFQFEIESDSYRLSNNIKDVYFSQQEKYYTDIMSFRVKYNYSFEKYVTLSPYVEFILDGHRYSGTEFQLFKSKSTGIGYSVGLNINVSL